VVWAWADPRWACRLQVCRASRRQVCLQLQCVQEATLTAIRHAGNDASVHGPRWTYGSQLLTTPKHISDSAYSSGQPSPQHAAVPSSKHAPGPWWYATQSAAVPAPEHGWRSSYGNATLPLRPSWPWRSWLAPWRYAVRPSRWNAKHASRWSSSWLPCWSSWTLGPPWAVHGRQQPRRSLQRPQYDEDGDEEEVGG
jgi:hypothetical protein